MLVQKSFLKINGKQSVKLQSGSIKFKNYFKQLAVPSKFYVDLASILYVLTINLASQLFFTEAKNAVNQLIE